eukprot:5601490-Amphidinium_carterae.1
MRFRQGFRAFHNLVNPQCRVRFSERCDRHVVAERQHVIAAEGHAVWLHLDIGGPLTGTDCDAENNCYDHDDGTPKYSCTPGLWFVLVKLGFQGGNDGSCHIINLVRGKHDKLMMMMMMMTMTMTTMMMMMMMMMVMMMMIVFWEVVGEHISRP